MFNITPFEGLLIQQTHVAKLKCQTRQPCIELESDILKWRLTK